MIIAQISDTHIALDVGDTDRRIADFERVVADINALEPAVDVIVHTGDIVHNGKLGEYEKAAEILATARAPVYLLVGNKDDRTNLRRAFPHHTYLDTASDFITYAVNDFPVTLVVLDTLNPQSKKGTFCTARFKKLAQLTEDKTDKPVAFFMHHPPIEISVGPDPVNFDSEDVMWKVHDVLKKMKRVAGIFCGHVHRSTPGHVGGSPVMVMQSIATTLRRGEYPDFMSDHPVYHVHRYDSAWGFTMETRIAGSGTDN